PARDGHVHAGHEREPGGADAERPTPDLLVTSVISGGVRERINDALHQAVRALGVEEDIPDLELGRAKVPEHGDYASSAGLKLARLLRSRPDEIAARLAEKVVVPDGAATAEAEKAYVNFRLTGESLRQRVTRV